MSQVDLADVKPHLIIADGNTGDDTLIQAYIDTAEDWVVKYLRRDLDSEFPTIWPATILHAVKLLVAHFYQNREPTSTDAMGEVPFSVKEILASERNLAG